MIVARETMSAADLVAIVDQGWVNLDYDVASGPIISDVSVDGLDLSGEAWHGVSFINVSFRSTDLTAMQFSRGYMRHCDLTGAKLAHSNLIKAEFHRCRLRGADLFGADMSRTVLYDCDLEGALIERTWLAGTGFLRGSLRLSSWSGSVLERASFREADIEGLSGERVQGSIARPGGEVSPARLGKTPLSFDAFLNTWNSFPATTITVFDRNQPLDPSMSEATFPQRIPFLRAAREAAGLSDDMPFDNGWEPGQPPT